MTSWKEHRRLEITKNHDTKYMSNEIVELKNYWNWTGAPLQQRDHHGYLLIKLHKTNRSYSTNPRRATHKIQFTISQRENKQRTYTVDVPGPPNIDKRNRFHTSDAFQVSINFLTCHLATSLLTTSLLTTIPYSRRSAQNVKACTNYAALASPSTAIKHFGDFKYHNSSTSGYSPKSQTTPFFSILETLCRSWTHAHSRYAC